ncbi:hypothetical protein [Salinimicrobium sp. WS361]
MEEDLQEFLVSSYSDVPATAINEALSRFLQKLEDMEELRR